MIHPLEIIEKYYPRGGSAHYILCAHSTHVKNKALEVALRNPKLNIDLQFVEEAAMLHDIGIFMCDAPRIYCFGAHHYIEHGYLGADILRDLGLPRHALVCERHTGVGLTEEMIVNSNLSLPRRDMLPLSIEEIVICYADKFYSKTQLDQPHSLERIRKHLNHFGADQVAKFDEWHTLFEGDVPLLEFV